MLYDNPAARLLATLEAGKAANAKENCRAVWTKLLFADAELTSTFVGRLGNVMGLPRETTTLLEIHAPTQIKSSEIWRKQIDLAFTNQNLSAHWGTFIDHVQVETISLLSLTSEILQLKLGAQLLKEDELNGFLDQFQQLSLAVQESQLAGHLKAYLLRELAELGEAIRTYRITGALPILRLSEALVGHAVLDEKYKSFLVDDKLGQRLLDHLTAMANVLAVATNIPVLTTTIRMLLG